MSRLGVRARSEARPARTSGPRRFSFVGVTTGESAIVRVFPVWAELLGLGDVVIAGHDLPLHAEPARYRELVAAIRDDPLDLGGLVTTHKLDLFAACRDLFDDVDRYAALCEEVSCLSKAGGRLVAHAKDPISAGRALDELVPHGHWRDTGAEALLLGAGGAGLAISLHLLAGRAAGDRPARIVVADPAAARLESMRRVHERIGAGVPVDYVVSAGPETADRLLAARPPGSLVVNGTGMGKDLPGSPLGADAVFPDRAVVWELNYRGELGFLRHAREQALRRRLTVEDGWRYFVHGWTVAMEEVFGLDIRPGVLEDLDAAARQVRS